MRLIDADALSKIMEIMMVRCQALQKKQAAQDYNFVITVLDTAPTVDAVPVVRCKDCKYLNRKTSVGGFCKCGEVNGGRPFGRVNDDFCSYGERRDSDV